MKRTKLSMSSVCFFSFIFLTILIIPVSAWTADYPNKPVTFMNWGSPGSGSDVCSRMLAQVTEKHLGQSINVINKRGGSGITALSYLLKQPADGYTVLLNTSSMPLVLLQAKIPFDYTNFTYVCRAVVDVLYLTVLSDSPFKTFQDFVQAAREKPGKISVAGAFVGGGYHQFMWDVMREANIKIRWVPYQGGKKGFIDLMGGHVDAAVCVSSLMLPQIKANKVRMLVNGNDKPVEAYPDVPTLKQLGYNVVRPFWRGVIVKKGTPANIVKKLETAYHQGMQEQMWRNKYLNVYNQMYGFMGSEEFTEFMKQEHENGKKYLKAIGRIK